MKSLSYAAAVFVVILVAVLAIGTVAQAQVATMPILYDQAGNPVNTGKGRLSVGYYYIGGGQAQGGRQVYYYGNGTYYDTVTRTYGGSVSNPAGTAGAPLNYAVPATTIRPGATTTPGMPNTGLGGQALYNWMLLVLSGLMIAGGASHLAFRRSS